MSNLRIIYKNSFDSYDTIGMLVGASAAGFPLTNLKTDSKIQTWRSTTLTPKISITWLTAKTISCVALAFTNLHAGSTFRVTLYNAAVAGTLLKDTGLVQVAYSYDAPLGFSSIGSASYAYGGGSNVDAFFGDVAGVLRMEIEFASAGNPDGYIEIGRIIAGDFWEPSRGAAYGASIGFVDATSGVRTSAGSYVTDRGTIHRELEFGLDAMPASDKAVLNNLFRYIGLSQPLFVSLTPGDTNTESEISGQIYGKLSESIATNFAFWRYYGANIKIVEL